MRVLIYKTKYDQQNKTPLIYNDVKRIVDQTSDNEIDIKINEKWLNIPNKNDYFLIVIEE